MRISSSKLLMGHLVAQVDMNIGGDPQINLIFQVIQVVPKSPSSEGFVLLFRAQDHLLILSYKFVVSTSRWRIRIRFQ